MTSAGTSTSGGMADMIEKEASGSPQGGLHCRSWTGACCGAGSSWSSGQTMCRRSSQRRRGTPAFLDSALSQFDGLDQACHMLVNSFRDLEPIVSILIARMEGGCPHGSGVSDLGNHKEEQRQPRTRPLVLLILLGRTCCLFHVGYMTAMVHMSVVEDMVFFLAHPSIG